MTRLDPEGFAGVPEREQPSNLPQPDPLVDNSYTGQIARLRAELDAAKQTIARLTEELSNRDDSCRHCGEKHAVHVGCRSDWTGVDKHGR